LGIFDVPEDLQIPVGMFGQIKLKLQGNCGRC